MASGLMLSSCGSSVGVGYRVYDPYYSDYHAWGPDEVGFYNRWEVEGHRGHREYRKLNRTDQRQYWTWRHGQEHR
jgi:hypothetical protein